MKEDTNRRFFMKLVKSFELVSASTKSGKKELLISITKGMNEAQLASKGKIKSRSAKSFLNEL